MSSFFKQKKMRREDYYYYNFFLKYENPDCYIRMQQGRKPKYSDIDIKGQNGFDFGTSTEDVIRTKGKPLSQKKSKVISDFSAMLYSSSINGYRIDMEYHFYNEKLFLIVDVFKNLNATENVKIIDTIQKKYLNEKIKDITDVKIIDADENILLIDNLFELRVNYMCLNTTISNEILDLNKAMFAKSKRIENCEFIGLL